MAPSEFVDVYDTTTGFVNRVPRIWVGDPVLGRNIALTAAQRELDGALAAAEQAEADAAAEAAAEMAETTIPDESAAVETPVESERPDEEWTAKRIEAFADGADIDLSGAKGSKADMVARINEVLDAPVELATTDPDGNPLSDETPAAGDEEN
jgi:hypothetical protein